jgi:hypothetical protein
MKEESHVVNACLDFLHIKKIFSWRNNTGAIKIGKDRFIRFGYVGSSDIVGVCPDGRILCIECKRPNGGRLSEPQKNFLDRINVSGGIGIVVHSVDELIKELKEADVI